VRQVLIGRGKAVVATVPAPLVEPGHLLVEVAYSLISTGTEITGVARSGKSLVKRAVEQPGRVKEVLNYLQSQGIRRTVAKVQGKLAKSPTGYSCSGTVIQVGEGVKDLQPGDLVACAGGGIATHAEIVLVPRSLLVRVPEGCGLKAAASVTLGSIAMQGLRRADPRLGDIVAVIGLGLLGQLTVQLLKAAGCRVIGLDLDARRAAIAERLGADRAFLPSEANVISEIRHLTAGHGVDATIITAASQSDAIVNQAMEITRKKGRVVVVGAVGLGLKRSPFYEKEIDFTIACSYGPGRYDERYETQGIDYPYAYVRWTENRNMQEYLRLIAAGKIQLDPILEHEYDITQAPQAFEALQAETEKPLAVLLAYAQGDEADRARKLERKVILRPHSEGGKINVAVVGAGSFAKSMHLPNLQMLSSLYHLRAVVSTTGSNAQVTAEQFKADYATTDYNDVLVDDSVDMVLIATRHHLHAPMAMAAARVGKAIFLEKPMALSGPELDELARVLVETRVPFMVGYNRRFSPAARRAREVIRERQNPLMILYRVNAGYLPRDHWTHGWEGGGRIVGEACHMFDLFQYLVAPARVAEIASTAIVPRANHISSSDNVVTTVRYDDGSVATLLYTALGAADLPKESVEVYTDGRILVIDDYRALRVYGASLRGWSSPVQDKGHLEELRAFATHLLDGSQPVIELDALVETARVTLEAAAAAGGEPAKGH
jgi:predicted dehydrogenase/threonine dehydrogenase-like Zn-dependent dehydrogenase